MTRRPVGQPSQGGDDDGFDPMRRLKQKGEFARDDFPGCRLTLRRSNAPATATSKAMLDRMIAPRRVLPPVGRVPHLPNRACIASALILERLERLTAG